MHVIVHARHVQIALYHLLDLSQIVLVDVLTAVITKLPLNYQIMTLIHAVVNLWNQKPARNALMEIHPPGQTASAHVKTHAKMGMLQTAAVA